MMEVLRGDFKKIPSVLSGEFGVDRDAAGICGAAAPTKKPQQKSPSSAGGSF